MQQIITFFKSWKMLQKIYGRYPHTLIFNKYKFSQQEDIFLYET